MLDDTMGPAVFVMTEGKLYTATITMTVNFLAPARPGPIVGEADVTQLGKTVAFVEGRLMADDGTVLATATTSARLVETAKAIPRERLDLPLPARRAMCSGSILRAHRFASSDRSQSSWREALRASRTMRASQNTVRQLENA